MTNPGNAVGTNAAYGGRTSVNAFNDNLAIYSRGILSGWACEPDSGLTVVLGGDGNTRDVAVAEDNAGNKTTINNISGSPVSISLGAAPGTNARIDAIVAYVDNPPQGSDTTADNPQSCGLIVVAGTPASTPIEPSDNTIRAAITADGASGATAYYVVLATVTITSGTTDIVSDDITAGLNSMIQARNIDPAMAPTEVYTTTTNQVQVEKDGWYHIEWFFMTPPQTQAGGGQIRSSTVSGTTYTTRIRGNNDGTIDVESFTYSGNNSQVFIMTDASTTGTGTAGWYVSMDLLKRGNTIRLLGNWRGINHISTGFTSSEFSAQSTTLYCARAYGSLVSSFNIKVEFTPLELPN